MAANSYNSASRRATVAALAVVGQFDFDQPCSRARESVAYAATASRPRLHGILLEQMRQAHAGLLQLSLDVGARTLEVFFVDEFEARAAAMSDLVRRIAGVAL